jgi:hypothetical protein
LKLEKKLKGRIKGYFDSSREKPQRGGPKDIFCPGLDGIKGGEPVYMNACEFM